MSTSKQVGFLSQVSTQVTFILFLAFTLVLVVVFYIVDTEGNEKIRAETDKLLVQTGNSVVGSISSDIERVVRRATQLKQSVQTLPIQGDVLQASLNNAFDKRDYNLIGSGGIWPDVGVLGRDTYPYLMVRQAGIYQPLLADPTPATPYYQADWFEIIKTLRPEECLWNHVRPTAVTGELAMSCGVAIERNDQFWGASTVNFTLNQVQDNIVKLSESFGSGYILLLGRVLNSFCNE